MSKLIVRIIIGLIIIMTGILNMKGNTSLLHSYHRKRVKKEGSKVWIGIVIVGITEILASIFTYFNYINISYILLGIGPVIAYVIIFYIIFIDNRGVF